jgi:Glycosyltransferase family 87
MERTNRRPQNDRLARIGFALALAWVLLAAFYVRGSGDDWRIFWNAGHSVGSGAIITAAHFAYTPGAAWILWPFAQLTLAEGYFLYVAIMIAMAVGAAWLATKLYGLSFALAALMAFAWTPFTIAICLGQNSPVALICVTLAIVAFVRRDQVLAGLAVGLLLYKPSDAVPMIFLLCICKQWRSLGIVAICGIAWYLLSAAATSDWLWPGAYTKMLTELYRSDVATNADYAISVPTLLTRLGAPALVGWIAGAAILVGSAPLLLRVRRLEAASVVPLIGVAASPHAWGYEAILALPALWLATSRLNSLRATLLLAAYAVAPLYLYARPLHFDALAIPILGGTACWFALRARSLANYWGTARNTT